MTVGYAEVLATFARTATLGGARANIGTMKLLAAAALAFAAPVFGQISCSYEVTPTAFTIGNQAYVATDSITVTPSASSFCNGWSASVGPGVNWLHIKAG